MQFIYLPSATVLKRWAGETASSVFVHVDESLQGMDVIRAFNAVSYFIQENVNLVNRHHLALFNTEQTHLWLAFWCDFFGAILVVATCLFSVGLSEQLGAANVGLAISNSIQVGANVCLCEPCMWFHLVICLCGSCACLKISQVVCLSSIATNRPWIWSVLTSY